MTRIVDLIDEAKVADLALSATASQLARMISAFRAADGKRRRQEQKRRANWRTRDDGMVDFRVCLPPEEAAVLIATITAAKDQFGAPAEQPAAGGCATADHTPDYRAADALLDVVRGFLATARGPVR